MIIKPIKNKKEANKTKPRRCWRCCMAQTTELQTELQVGTSSHFDSGDENSSPSLKYQSANRLSLQVLFKHL